METSWLCKKDYPMNHSVEDVKTAARESQSRQETGELSSSRKLHGVLLLKLTNPT